MAEKLLLPFSLLSDPAGEAIKRYGLWDENVTDYGIFETPQSMARPAIIVVDRTGIVRYVYVGQDFADRPGDEPVYGALDAGEDDT